MLAVMSYTYSNCNLNDHTNVFHMLPLVFGHPWWRPRRVETCRRI